MNIIKSMPDSQLEKHIQKKVIELHKFSAKIEYTTVLDEYKKADDNKTKHLFKIRTNDVIQLLRTPQASLNWHFYKKMLKRCNKQYIVKEYQMNERMTDIDAIKELTNWAFIKGVKDYQFIMGCETLYGWEKNWDDTDIIQKIKNWVNSKFEPMIDNSVEKFNEVFRQECRKYYRDRAKKKFSIEKIDDFLVNLAETGTSGSALDKQKEKMKVQVEGYDVKLDNTKYAREGNLSIAEKKERIYSKTSQKNNISVKVEFYPKVRIIVSSDISSS